MSRKSERTKRSLSFNVKSILTFENDVESLQKNIELFTKKFELEKK